MSDVIPERYRERIAELRAGLLDALEAWRSNEFRAYIDRFIKPIEFEDYIPEDNELYNKLLALTEES